MNFSFLNQLENISNLFLANSSGDASSAASGAGGGTLLLQIAMFGGIGLFFYFIIIRPQKKKEKETQAMRSSVQIGDEIVTIGGIVGLVVRKTEDTIVLETGGDKSKLRIQAWAVQDNLSASERAKATVSTPTVSKGDEKK